MSVSVTFVRFRKSSMLLSNSLIITATVSSIGAEGNTFTTLKEVCI